jgi:hypothetical protein
VTRREQDVGFILLPFDSLLTGRSTIVIECVTIGIRCIMHSLAEGRVVAVGRHHCRVSNKVSSLYVFVRMKKVNYSEPKKSFRFERESL